MLASCGSSSPTSGVRYQIYTYSCCAEIGPQMTIWHAGQRQTLHWQPQAGAPTADNTPHQLTLRLTLTGPFPTVDALKQAISQGRNPPGVRSIDAATTPVNDRTAEVPASELDLPSDQAPGYYNLDSTVSIGANSAGGATIVSIQ